MEDSNQTLQAQGASNQMPSIDNNSSKSKVIPIILGIAAAIVIAIGAYLLGTKQSQPIAQNILQPTPIPSPAPTSTPIVLPTTDPSITANWKIYNNEKFGPTYAYHLLLKYPSNWKLREHDYGTGIDVNFLSPDYRVPDRGAVEEVLSGARVEVSLAQKLKSDTLIDWFKGFYNDSRSVLLIKSRPFSMASGLEGLEFDGPGSLHDQSLPSETSHTKVFTIGDTVYVFKVVFKDDSTKYIPLLNQILSTFKFTP